MEETIKLGISTCLLGENVRYDGGHKLDRFLRDTLGQWVTYVPVCPEVECGLPIPRESMHLEGDTRSPRLVTSRTKKDITDQMTGWARTRLRQLESEKLCGFIFKAHSPSSGMERVRVYDDKGMPHKAGVGIFARMFMEHFPLLPTEDEGRLNDAGLRENFIERVFTLKRWREHLHEGRSRRGLIDFHARHKLLILSHSPVHLGQMGKLVAAVKDMPIDQAYEDYHRILMGALRLKATVKKHTSVLQHLMGYFKRMLSPDEKQELLKVIETYHRGYTPLIAPITLINHYVRKYDQPYLKQQVYLNPHPVELMLRNHV